MAKTKPAAKPAPAVAGLPTHALSVCQPWAWAIVRGHKSVENRTWATNHRGLIAIHASTSKRHVNAEVECFLIDAGDHVFEELNHPAHTNANPCFYYGAIVGVAEIVGCIESDGMTLEADAADAGLAGWYGQHKIPPAYWAEGPQCWLLANAVEFAQPIECKGALNLWRLTAELQAKIAAELQRKPRMRPVDFVEMQNKLAARARLAKKQAAAK